MKNDFEFLILKKSQGTIQKEIRNLKEKGRRSGSLGNRRTEAKNKNGEKKEPEKYAENLEMELFVRNEFEFKIKKVKPIKKSNFIDF